MYHVIFNPRRGAGGARPRGVVAGTGRDAEDGPRPPRGAALHCTSFHYIAHSTASRIALHCIVLHCIIALH